MLIDICMRRVRGGTRNDVTTAISDSQTTQGRSVSIVIPCFNAEGSIERLCDELVALYAAPYDLEIVLVNDCSKDGTDAACRRLQAKHRAVIRYALLSKNFGEHNAVMAGLTITRGDWCVIMDDDFQNPPEEVATLLAATADHDVVYAQYGERKDPWFRNVGSHVNDWMATRALGKPRDLYLSSFKALNRFLVSEVTKFKGPDPYIDALILRTTGRIGRAQIRHQARHNSQSGYTFKKLFGLWSNMLIVFSLYPIRIIGLIGLLVLIYGTYLLAEDTYHTVVHPPELEPTEVESLKALLVFLRGINMFATGILGEYIGRMLTKFNSNPQYVVREILHDGPGGSVRP